MFRKPIKIALFVTVIVVASLFVARAEGSGPNDFLIKPGDSFRYAALPDVVCAVNQAVPRGSRPNQPKVVTFACWQTTESGLPVPNGKIIFLWVLKEKSLVGYTSWNDAATKFRRPTPDAVFTLDSGWPAKYTKDPFFVTESQRLGQRIKIAPADPGRSLTVGVTPWVDVNCSQSVSEVPDALCTPLDRRPTGKNGLGIAWTKWENKLYFGLVEPAPTCPPCLRTIKALIP